MSKICDLRFFLQAILDPTPDRLITWWLWLEDGGDDTDLPFGGQIYRLKMVAMTQIYSLKLI
uniref:Uncharacterized protein n=1 Tax=Helianthus annuus TaxID=4232 RepID=A0A251UPN0_HELAN